MKVSLKNPISRGRVGSFTKKHLPKKGRPWGAWSKREDGVLEGGWYSNELYVIFDNPCDHGAVTHLENVWELNKTRGKKLDISLLLRHPLT